MDNVFNVIEVSGSSSESWETAAQAALDHASSTLDGPLADAGTLGAEVLKQTLSVSSSGELVFEVTLGVSAEIDLSESADSSGPRPKRFLIVANQTLASAGLEHLVHEIRAKGHAHFHVVVPQVSSSAVHLDPSGLIDTVLHTGVDDASSVARREAENRLQTFRQLFDETGEATLTGEVVDCDPLQAVRQALARTEFDEIIVSTLPAGVSKWLHMDLPHRISRAVDIPVTSLVQQFTDA